MKFIKVVTFAAALLASSASFADQDKYIDGYDVLFDVAFVRPLSFVGMVAGTAVFVGLSPLTAIATIPAPHTAFQDMAETIIVKPAKYTFARPAGDFDYK